jgi:1-acyl-sn-glycerol-3-phosphate acyltransferase
MIKKNLRFLFKLLFIKVNSEGSENVEPQKTYLFMCNHSSLFDIPLLEAYIPTFVRGVEALRQFKWPVYGWVIKRLGNIPIDRKNIHASIRSMKTTEQSLKGGMSIVILPEGHRTLDGNLGAFKRLPFHLAKQAGVPIFPIGISGLFQLKQKGSWLIRPRPVSIKFGEPMDVETICYNLPNPVALAGGFHHHCLSTLFLSTPASHILDSFHLDRLFCIQNGHSKAKYHTKI